MMIQQDEARNKAYDIVGTEPAVNRGPGLTRLETLRAQVAERPPIENNPNPWFFAGTRQIAVNVGTETVNRHVENLELQLSFGHSQVKTELCISIGSHVEQWYDDSEDAEYFAEHQCYRGTSVYSDYITIATLSNEREVSIAVSYRDRSYEPLANRLGNSRSSRDTLPC